MVTFTDQLAIAQLLSEVLASDRFAIAGGIAVRLHGFGERPTADLDMFTSSMSVELAECVERAVGHLERNGYGVSIDSNTLSAQFARLEITFPTGEIFKVELGFDWREHPTQSTKWGPVINRRDSITSKASTLWARREVRDAIDVVNILNSGEVSAAEIETLLAESDAGFTLDTFLIALRAASLHTDAQFALYSVNSQMAAAIRSRLGAWADDVAERIANG